MISNFKTIKTKQMKHKYKNQNLKSSNHYPRSLRKNQKNLRKKLKQLKLRKIKKKLWWMMNKMINQSNQTKLLIQMDCRLSRNLKNWQKSQKIRTKQTQSIKIKLILIKSKMKIKKQIYKLNKNKRNKIKKKVFQTHLMILGPQRISGR